MLSDEAVEKFKKIYEYEFGTFLSPEEARESAEHLLRIYRAVLKDREEK